MMASHREHLLFLESKIDFKQSKSNECPQFNRKFFEFYKLFEQFEHYLKF